MMDIYSVIKKPLLTEKGVELKNTHNRFMFEVDIRANKGMIKEAVKKLFNVTPLEVRTMVVRGKVRTFGRHSGKRRNWKKAIVTLKDGERLDIFEGA